MMRTKKDKRRKKQNRISLHGHQGDGDTNTSGSSQDPHHCSQTDSYHTNKVLKCLVTVQRCNRNKHLRLDAPPPPLKAAAVLSVNQN